jgi:hypothetical protein
MVAGAVCALGDLGLNGSRYDRPSVGGAAGLYRGIMARLQIVGGLWHSSHQICDT